MSFKNHNKFFNKANFSITVIIVIGILIMANFFSYQLFYRWDLTQNKDYSISKVTKEAVGELNDIINIKAYFSENLPSQYISLPQEVKDILDEYVNYSNGKIQAEFINPKDGEEMARELYMQGIPQLQFNVLEKDKYQVVKGYLGILVQYGGKSEPIPVVESTYNLEYKITSAIKKVTADEIANVGFLAGNSSLNVDNEISLAYKKLQEIYNVRRIDLTNEKEIPADIKTLIIVGPKEKFAEDRLKAIDAFLMRGGSILILADGVKVADGLMAEINDLGLNKILENYGLKLNNDLVVDSSNGIASFNQGFFTFSTNYPYWPKVLKQNFDKSNAAVANLESLMLPWASTIDVNQEKLKGNKIYYLARSSENSWRENENFDLSPQKQFSLKGEKGQWTMAVAVSGKFFSAYGQGETNNGRVIVVGDSDFINNNFAQGNPDNFLFFQNIVDSLALDEDLINIRSKGITERPIKELSEGVKAAVKYFNIFGMTIFVMAFGLARYYLRRKRRFADEL